MEIIPKLELENSTRCNMENGLELKMKIKSQSEIANRYEHKTENNIEMEWKVEMKWTLQ